MKQNIDPRIAIGIIAVIVIVVAGMIWHTYTAGGPASGGGIVHPASAGTGPGAGGGGSRARVEEMRRGHMER